MADSLGAFEDGREASDGHAHHVHVLGGERANKSGEVRPIGREEGPLWQRQRVACGEAQLACRAEVGAGLCNICTMRKML